MSDRYEPSDLPDLQAGIYRHYKGPLYLVFGYGHDANQDGRTVVVYVGLQLDGAHTGTRLAVRDVADFHAIVNSKTGQAVDRLYSTDTFPRRFTYVGPSWEGWASEGQGR